MTGLRLVLRGLLHAPLFTTTAVLSLALGIGANAAMFSMLDRLLLRTLPVPRPAELVSLYHPGPVQGSTHREEGGSPPFRYPQFRGLQRAQTPFTGLVGTQTRLTHIAHRGDAASGDTLLVSGNYFPVLGIQPAIGRLLTESDDRTPGAHPVVVLSHDYWERRFGSNPALLNDTLVVNNHPMTIVGVAQKGFTGERQGSRPDIFAPISMRKALTRFPRLRLAPGLLGRAVRPHRTREIGIRMALGARARQVRGLVIREMGRILAIGLVAGVGAAAALGTALRAALYQMEPWDPAGQPPHTSPSRRDIPGRGRARPWHIF